MATLLGERGGKMAGKRERADNSLEKDSSRSMKIAKAAEEFKVIFKLKDQIGGGFRGVNPLKVVESLKKFGDGLDARVLSSGALLVICKDQDQVGKVRKITKIAGQKVDAAIAESKEIVKGVIYGVCAEVTERDIQNNIKGGIVDNVKRFNVREGGNPNAPVLISFNGKVLPERVFLGCLSFQVKPYQRPPLRCFKCQRYGHMAASCNGGRRCAKCGGDHDVVICEVESPKCCNCGESHLASSRECRQFVRAKQVQEIRDQQKVSYAEALKRVEGNSHMQVSVSTSRGGPAGGRGVAPNSQDILVGKEALLAFIVDVMYGARDKKSRSDIIKSVCEAASRFLGRKNYSPQKLHAAMRAAQMSVSQPGSQSGSQPVSQPVSQPSNQRDSGGREQELGESEEEEGCDIEDWGFEDNIDDV